VNGERKEKDEESLFLSYQEENKRGVPGGS